MRWPGKRPERLLSNGLMTAAVEVKRVMGSRGYRYFEQAHRTQYAYLAPTYGGKYQLLPPATISPFWPGTLMNAVRRSIESKARDLAAGQETLVDIERSALLEMLRIDGPRMVLCEHDEAPEFFPSSRHPNRGLFFLRDGVEGFRWPHSLISQVAFDELARSVAAGAEQAVLGVRALVTWREEWRLKKLSATGAGVSIGTWHVEWVGKSIQEEVAEAL